MNPIVLRKDHEAEAGPQPPEDAPVQALPWAEDGAGRGGPGGLESACAGHLFLPGWLRLELPPSAEQGPGA